MKGKLLEGWALVFPYLPGSPVFNCLDKVVNVVKGGVWVQNWPGGGCGHTGEKTGGSVVAGAGGDSQESELLLSNELPDLLMDSRQV